MKKVTVKLIILVLVLWGNSLIAQWNPCNNGIDSGAVVMTMQQLENNIFIGTKKNGIFRSLDLGRTWVVKNTGLSNLNIFSMAVKDNLFLTGTDGSGVFVSSNNGETWSAKRNGLIHMVVESFFIEGNRILIGTYGEIYSSTDNCETWVPANSGLTGANILTIKRKDGLLILGTTGNSNSGVFISTDDGTTWQIKNNGLDLVWVRTMLITGNYIFVGTGGSGVFRSEDNCENWVMKNAGLTNGNVKTLEIYNNLIFAGTNEGIFISGNFGESWKPVNDGLTDGNTVPIVRAIVKIGDTLFAGTSIGVFKADINDLIPNGITDNPENVYITLYPNPAHDFISLCNVEENCKYYIYDIIGNIIQKGNLTNSIINIENLPEGLYILHINYGKKSLNRWFLKK